MAYIAKEIKWYMEATPGTKPASPKNHVLASAEGFSVVETEKSEDVILVGNDGEASGKAYGSSSFAGDIGLVLSGDMMPLILHHGVGEATVTAGTSDDWVLSTAYTVGDIVNHSNDTHSLYCLTAGTSHTTEPTITTQDEYDQITDNTVTWVLRDTLKKYTGEREACLETFGLELTVTGACAGAGDEQERTGGCYINSLELGKSGSDISMKTSVNVIGTNRDNSITNASYPAQGGTDYAMSKEYFGNCDLEVKLDDTTATNITNLKVVINRNVSTEDTLICAENIVSVGVISMDGSISGLFSTDLYEKGSNHTTHKLELIYTHMGDTTTITFPNIVFEKSPIKVESQKNCMIDGKFSAIGSAATPSVNYVCISSTVYED